MHLLLISLLSFFLSPMGWGTDFQKASEQAQKEHKLILLNFSGSDWCGPCIRLKKEIFETKEFETFADQCLVLVNADFPRLKKNQLMKEQTKLNETLADKYNAEGAFPLTLLLNSDCKVLKKWNGLPSGNAGDFTKDLARIFNANK